MGVDLIWFSLFIAKQGFNQCREFVYVHGIVPKQRKKKINQVGKYLCNYVLIHILKKKSLTKNNYVFKKNSNVVILGAM